jgi:hypothetical protein
MCDFSAAFLYPFSWINFVFVVVHAVLWFQYAFFVLSVLPPLSLFFSFPIFAGPAAAEGKGRRSPPFPLA